MPLTKGSFFSMPDTTYSLPPTLALRDMADLRIALLQVAETAGPATLTLDAADTAKLTGAGLQLFCSLAKTMKNQGGQLRLINDSGAMGPACAALGLTDIYENGSTATC